MPSYVGPKIWNSLSSDLKSANNVNSFKHKIKDNFSKIYRERKGTYTVCLLKRRILIMLYPKAHSNIYYIFSFAITSKGTIMEIRPL